MIGQFKLYKPRISNPVSKHKALIESLNERLTNEVTQLKKDIADRKTLYRKMLDEKDKVLKTGRDELARFQRLFSNRNK